MAMKRSTRHVLILGALCALALLPGLGRPAMDRAQELRVALTARNMLAEGNWLTPTYRGEPRFQKPPLMYWLTAAAFKAAGTTKSTAVARLPSAAAGVALIFVIYFGGRYLMGERRRAWYAALIAVSSMLFIRHARLAETDILQAAMLTLAMFSLFIALKEEQKWQWWSLAGIFAGLGFLTKGPASLVVPLMTLPLYVWTSPEARRRTVWHGAWIAPLLFLILALPWYLYVTTADLVEEAAEAAVASELSALLTSGDHPGPWDYYLVRLPALMMPWGLLFPFALWGALRYGRKHDGLRFSLCWLGASMLLLSLLHNKQGHYATLMLSPSAILLGWYLSGLYHRSFAKHAWISYISRTALIILMLAGSYALLYASSRGPVDNIGWLCASVLIGLLALALFADREVMTADGVMLVALAVLCAGGIYIGGYTAFEQDEIAVRHFVDHTKPILKKAHVLHAVGPESAEIEFYIGRRLLDHARVEEAWAAARPGDVVILTSTRKRPIDLDRAPGDPDWIEDIGGVTCVLYHIE